MTMRLLSMILLWCTCASLLATAQCPPAVTLDGCTYATIKAKITAADAMRAASQSAIDGLKAERDALQTQVNQLGEVGLHDVEQITALNLRLGEIDDELSIQRGKYDDASHALDLIKQVLPARKRRQATSPEKLAQLVTEQLEAGQKAPLKWGIIGSAVTFLLTLFL